jgi:hypothetical protein
MAELVFFRRGTEVLRVALERQRSVLGRAEDCDIVIPDPQVSRQHVALLLDGTRCVLPRAGEEETSVAPQAAASKEPLKEKTPRGDWAELLKRTFDFDVFACVRCGGRRRVLAYVKEAGGVRAILEHLGLPTAGARLAPARGPPQAAWC